MVFVGEEGVGACQKKEVLVAIIQHTEDDDSYKIIPVILASQNHCAKRPWFLTNYQWIVFESATDGNALEQLKTALNKDSAFKIKINGNPCKGLEYFDDAHLFFG